MAISKNTIIKETLNADNDSYEAYLVKETVKGDTNEVTNILELVIKTKEKQPKKIISLKGDKANDLLNVFVVLAMANFEQIAQQKQQQQVQYQPPQQQQQQQLRQMAEETELQKKMRNKELSQTELVKMISKKAKIQGDLTQGDFNGQVEKPTNVKKRDYSNMSPEEFAKNVLGLKDKPKNNYY